MTIPSGTLVVLDTCVLVHLARGKAAGIHLDSAYQLRARPDRPLISRVTVGELFAIAKKNNWGPTKRNALTGLLNNLVIVEISPSQVIDAYADLDHVSESNGLNLGKNDLWIAACTKAVKGWLLTTDKDFNRLPSGTIDLTWIDPNSLPKG